MATYNGWTEVREYRVWMAEDTYAVVTVAKHRNGWFHVYEDGSDAELKTRSEIRAFGYAGNRMDDLVSEAEDSCTCMEDGWYEECAYPEVNVYDSAHGVRDQIVDMIENRRLDRSEA